MSSTRKRSNRTPRTGIGNLPTDLVLLHGRYCGGACERRGPWEDALDMACWEHYLCTLDAGLDVNQTCRCDADLLDEAERHNDTDLARVMMRALEQENTRAL